MLRVRRLSNRGRRHRGVLVVLLESARDRRLLVVVLDDYPHSKQGAREAGCISQLFARSLRQSPMSAALHTKPFIGGRYVEAASGTRFEDIEPATETILAEVANGGIDDVDHAVKAARDAANRGPWPKMSAEERAAVLNKMADGIERRAKELGTIEARDVGKPVSECVNHDVARAAKNLRFFAAAAQSWVQEAALSDAKFLGEDLKLVNLTERPPLGVGAIIIPWNSPL